MKFAAFNCFIGLACLSATLVSGQEQKKSPKKNVARPAQVFKLPDNVRVEANIVYAKYGTRELMLDLYLPKEKPASPMPCSRQTEVVAAARQIKHDHHPARLCCRAPARAPARAPTARQASRDDTMNTPW